MYVLRLLIVVLLAVTSSFAQATFGPYTPDGNTVLLMHFDGDLTDASGTNEAGISIGDVTFNADARFGQSVYLNNSGTFPDYQALLTQYGTDTTNAGGLKADSAYYADAVANDTSYVIIPANSALDLNGDWTIEGWIKNVDNQYWSTGGYIVSKTDTLGENANYLVQNNPGQFSAGFTENNEGYTAWDGSQIPNFFEQATGEQVNPVDSTDAPKEYRYGWLHFTFQHDAVNKWIALATHNANGELLSYTTYKILGNDLTKTVEYQSHPGNGVPSIEIGDSLVIGFGNNKSVHAYIDELRISNVVRPLDGVPPVFRSSEIWGYGQFWSGGRLANQDVSLASYPVKAEIRVLGNPNGVNSASLHYHTRMYPLDERVPIDDAGWQTVAMTQQGDGITWMGEIPQQPFKTVVEYYMTAETSDGIVDTIGINHDRWSHHYQGSGWYITDEGKGMPDTYYRFIVWKKNSMVLDINMDDLQPDNVPADVSEWGEKLFAVGSYTLPDDVPDEAAAGASFSSLALTQDQPGYLEMLDTDHLNSLSWTFSYWVKVDTFNNAHTIAKQNGSRWEDEEPNFDEGWAYGFWQNNPGMDARNPNNYLRMYSLKPGDRPHPFIPQDVYDLETGKWYHHLAAIDYTGDPTQDSIYVQVVDEDGFLMGRVTYPLRVPPCLVDGRLRIGHRGHPGIPYFTGNIDHIKMWNYYISPEENPDLWAYTISAIDDETAGVVPFKFALFDNYPNPFNPNTTIKFTIPKFQEIKLAVYDILGKRVKTLISRKLPLGKYDIEWDGTNKAGEAVASGLYFYRLSGENIVITKKMLLVR